MDTEFFSKYLSKYVFSFTSQNSSALNFTRNTLKKTYK